MVLVGKVVEEFEVGGLKVVLRYPRFEDYPDLLSYANSLVREGAPILTNELISKKEELRWIAKRLIEIEEGKRIMLVVEINNRVVGCAEAEKGRGRKKHVCKISIGLERRFRNKGIGQKLLSTLLDEAKRRLRCKVAVLLVFEDNAIARHVYEKLGFRVVGRIEKGIKRGNEYIDELIMQKEL